MKFKSAFLAAALSVASCDQALFAADIPLKAPRLAAPYPIDSSGAYWMIGAYGEATKIGIAAPTGAAASTFAAGGTLSAGGGYIYTFGPNRWIAVEGSVNYANTGANQIGVQIDNRISATQRLLYGGDTSMLTQWLPNLSTAFPVLPPLPALGVCPVGQTCNPLAHPYIGAVLHEAKNEVVMAGFKDRPIRLTYGATMGIVTKMTDGSAVDTWTSVTSSSGAHLNSGAIGLNVREGMTYRAGVTWKNGISRN